MSIRLRANGRKFRRSGMDTDFYVGHSSFSTILSYSQTPQSLIDKMSIAYRNADSVEVSASEAKLLAQSILYALRILKWDYTPSQPSTINYSNLYNWLMVCGGFTFND